MSGRIPRPAAGKGRARRDPDAGRPLRAPAV